MNLLNSRDQQLRDHYYRADGAIASGGTPQLLLPERKSTSFLLIQNNSTSDDLWLEFGSARATATLTGGQVTSFTVTNGGFGFIVPPKVHLWGGGTGGNPLFPGVGMPNWPAPGDAGFTAPRQGSTTDRIAKAHAVLTTGVVTSIVVDDPGSGYVAAPFVFMENSLSPPDPFGVANPFFGSALSGIPVVAGGSYYVNGTHCTTDAIGVYGATTGDSWAAIWAP
jgi:hypothetical protein